MNNKCIEMLKSFNMMSLVLAVVLLVFAASAYAGQDTDYKLGAEDVITVTAVDHAEFSGDFYIPSEGSVTFPGAGSVKVVGKTLSELANELKSRFSDRGLRDPEVYITVKNPRPLQVNVLGSVKAPGAYSLKTGWRITEALSAAGGITANVQPADCTVVILRDSTTKHTVPLQEALRGSESSNLLLQPGDVMTVEPVEMIPVYVMGKVRSPGLYSMRKDSATVLSAVTIAGGTLEDAALSKVTVTHLSGESETVSIVPVTIEGKQESNSSLRSGDMVVVPESIAKFAVLGWVNNPGTYPLKENQVIRLSDALGIANGPDKQRSALEKVVILRSENGKQERLMFNFNKFAKNGDITQNPEIHPQDIVLVPETKTWDLDRIISRFSSSLSVFWMLDRFNK